MKFTIQRTALVKMIKLVAKRMPGQKKAEPDLRLSACAARVFVESNQTTAGLEALVFADGQCVVSRQQFLAVLDTYRGVKHLTFEGSKRGLKVARFTMPAWNYSAQTQAPGRFVVFPVTDLGVVSKDQVPLNPHADTAEVAGRVDFPTECDKKISYARMLELLAGTSIKLARALCGRTEVNPKMMMGLARAIYALEKLPRFVSDVDVAFMATLRKKIEGGFKEIGCFVLISKTGFQAGGEGISEVENLRTVHRIPGCSIQPSEVKGAMGDRDYAESIEWQDFAQKLVDEIPGAELVVQVEDESDSDCLG